MSNPQMTTAEALRSALASTIACSAQELQEAVGQLVVATTGELPAASAVGPADRSLFDASTSTLVLLADRIPAGQEAQALVTEIGRHHGRQVAQVVLGERAIELLGGFGQVTNYIEHPPAFFDSTGVLRSWEAADQLPSDWTGIAKRKETLFVIGKEGGEMSYTALQAKTMADARDEISQRKLQGHVERAEAVNKLADAVQAHQTAQVERDTMLLGRNQVAMAERAFEAYNFGEGVAVADVSGWEYYAAGHERSREVYLKDVNNDGKEMPPTRLGFTVRYDPQTGALIEAYAEDATGSSFGYMPEGQLEKLNADSAVGKVEPPPATLRQPLTDAALKIVEDVCRDFDGNGIYSVGASAALRAMAHHWKDHRAEGHSTRIISDDIDEMKSQLEVMRAEVMRRVAEQTAPQFEGAVLSSTKAVEHAPTDSVLVSLDGGATFVPARSGVRIVYQDVLVPGEDALGELHLNATPEGLISDLWVSRDDHLDHNLGTSSEMLDDLVERLVDDPVSEHELPNLGM